MGRRDGPTRDEILPLNIKAAWRTLWDGSAKAVPLLPNPDRTWAHGYQPSLNNGRLPGPDVDWMREAGDAWLAAPVMACLGWLYDNLPTADMAVYTPSSDSGQDDQPDFEHPAVTLFDEADGMDAHELLGLGVMSDKLFGETYYRKVFDFGDQLSRLQWVPPYRVGYRTGMIPVSTTRTLVDHFEYWVDGRKVEENVPAEEVVYIRAMPDPCNPLYGISRLRAGLRMIVGMNRAENYLAQFLQYGTARKLFVPEMAGYVDETTAEGVRNQIAGIDLTRPGWIPVSSLPGNIVDIGASPLDAVPREMTDWFESTICALMGMSTMVVGLASGVMQRTFSNLKEADSQTWRNSLMPTQDRFARAFTKSILPDFDAAEDQYVGWDYTKVAALNEDRNEKVKRALEMGGGKWGSASAEGIRPWSTNEIRNEAGLPPVPWGDDLQQEPAPILPASYRRPAVIALDKVKDAERAKEKAAAEKKKASKARAKASTNGDGE